MDASFLKSMELPSMDYAYKNHSLNACHFGKFVGGQGGFRMGYRSNKKGKVLSFSKQKIVSQAFENEATQSGRTMNDHDLRASRSIGKHCDSSKIQAHGKGHHVNGATHYVEQNTVSPMVGGHEVMTEKSMDEKISIQGDQDFQFSSKTNSIYNVENSTCVGVDKFVEAKYRSSLGTKTTDNFLEAKNHASLGATTSSTIYKANVNGYLQLMQGPYQQHYQPSTPTIANEGLGIIDFLKGKSILITGATGFLAKVLVEKILRVQPDVGHIFLLIKAKDINHAKDRLQSEILQSSLFEKLQSFHGVSYQSFMERKVSPIVGNLAKDNLGMDMKTMADLQKKVEILVNSAASTTFDERYDHALNLNTKGAQRIVEFGNHCPQLQLLMHVSTAFVNGERKGVVKERAFKLGCSIAKESSTQEEDMVPDIDVDMELRLVKTQINDILQEESQSNVSLENTSLDDQRMEKKLQQTMRDLGMKRAKQYGWQDTYVFTKALGEMLIDSTRGQLPVVIIRPSVVESSLKDPFPGWMEGNRMMDPILISYGKGQLPGFLVDPKCVLDVVPVDMVANSMLAAMARHANKPCLEVYQVASSVVNPLVFLELARMSREHFKEHPFIDKHGKPLITSELELYEDMESFMDAVTTCSHSTKESLASTTNMETVLKRRKQLTLKVKQQAAYLASLYQPYTFYAGRFDTSKTQQLFANLSFQEKEMFGFDVNEIDWDAYIKNIHIPGLRKHVLKGRGSSQG